MSNESIKAYLQSQKNKSFLRLMTCGSVDDGKSTLIGRLLFENNSVPSDLLKGINTKRDNSKINIPDYAYLLDGLSDEREQGITIDVSYKSFETLKRKFLVADAPGHEQYTRNMVTAASNSEAAIILIDSKRGLKQQTKRHIFICTLLGIRNLIFAINKMDVVNYSKKSFLDIESDISLHLKKFSNIKPYFIPISALKGENLTEKSEEMQWYKGHCLLTLLEKIKPFTTKKSKHWYLPIQLINRPNSSFRGYSGTLLGGMFCEGDEVICYPGMNTTKIKSILTSLGKQKKAEEGEAITIELDDEIDVARGNIITKKGADNLYFSAGFSCNLIWLSETQLVPKKTYVIKFSNAQANGQIIEIESRIDINSGDLLSAKTLLSNEIGICKILLDARVLFLEYEANKKIGSFIIIDNESYETVGAGLIRHSLHRDENVTKFNFKIGKKQRALAKLQKPKAIWMTGLSGAGKSTIANLLERELHQIGKHTYLLDGDNLRLGLNRDLGFTEASRIENLRRAGEITKLMLDAGLIVISSFISPFTSERKNIRELFEKDEFIEVFIDSPLDVCIKRDPKGLYKRALKNEIPNFTGISAVYEPPLSPDIHIKTKEGKPEEAVKKILSYLDL